jgi:hypothetical protein
LLARLVSRWLLAAGIAPAILSGCGVYILDPPRPTLVFLNPLRLLTPAEFVIIVHRGRGLEG